MRVEIIDNQKWNTYLEQCPNATFFHTPDWYEAWKQYEGQAYQAFYFTFTSGQTALLPLASIKKHRGFFKFNMSAPAGTYGGPISQNNLEESAVKKIEKFIRKYNYISIRNNPLAPILKNINNKKEETQIIDLSLGWESVFKNWSTNHTRAAKKSIQKGITFRPAKKEEWQLYFDIYQDTYQRWENPPAKPYQWPLFEILREIDENKCTLWLALLEDKPIAGALFFYFQNHLVYWHGASLASHMENKPMQGLQMHIMKDAIAKGYQWYDFNPSANLEGVIKFKKGFGAQMKSANVYAKEPFLLKLIFNLMAK